MIAVFPKGFDEPETMFEIYPDADWSEDTLVFGDLDQIDNWRAELAVEADLDQVCARLFSSFHRGVSNTSRST